MTATANSTDFKQFSEELRLAGKSGPAELVGGRFFNNEILTTRSLILAGNQFETYISAVASASIGAGFNPLLVSQLTGDAPGATYAGTGYNDSYQQTSRSFALFTNETYNITNGLGSDGGPARHGGEENRDGRLQRHRRRTGLRRVTRLARALYQPSGRPERDQRSSLPDRIRVLYRIQPRL